MATGNYLTRLSVFFVLYILSVAQELFPVPTNFQAKFYCGQILLTWDQPINTNKEVTHYLICKRDNKNPEPIYFKVASSNRYYIVPNVTVEKEYTFYIQAKYGDGRYSKWYQTAWIPINSERGINSHRRNTRIVPTDTAPECISLKNTTKQIERNHGYSEVATANDGTIIILAMSSATLFLSSGFLLIIVIRLKRKYQKQAQNQRYLVASRDTNTSSTHMYDAPTIPNYIELI